ncbi:hypothetical protein [Methylobacterium nodulans]|uniref:Uncharacterized protein n=1 Tax=Methylobacterium nodulans (strain LMG 21967 / CNCM I-2342 / ORS 2060) TaxID=460265 RepID=B8IIQ9_METNO|nr:hypothetical protein [Methylobacterium nodulans]ACL59936.1 hypothetical protein Mnod_5090 [Methylobacterium nodulans ORS 2060]
MSAPYSLPWSLGSVEHVNGEPVTDTAVIYLSGSGVIEVNETENAGQVANLILAAPDLLDGLRRAVDALAEQKTERGCVSGLLAVIAKAEGRSC